MSNQEEPTCYDCESPCAGDVTGTLWCCVCAKRQPDPPPEKTYWQNELEKARERLKDKQAADPRLGELW